MLLNNYYTVSRLELCIDTLYKAMTSSLFLTYLMEAVLYKSTLLSEKNTYHSLIRRREGFFSMQVNPVQKDSLWKVEIIGLIIGRTLLVNLNKSHFRAGTKRPPQTQHYYFYFTAYFMRRKCSSKGIWINNKITLTEVRVSTITTRISKHRCEHRETQVHANVNPGFKN